MMFKKAMFVLALWLLYKHPDAVCDAMIRSGVGFKAGVKASHQDYSVKSGEETINSPIPPLVPSPQKRVLLPGPDGLIDPWPESN